MPDVAPFLITSGTPTMPETFLLPVVTTQERWDMLLSALIVGGEVLYGEDEILHLCDVLEAMQHMDEETSFDVHYPNGYSWLANQFSNINGGFSAPVYSGSSWLGLYCLMTGLNSEVGLQFPIQAGNYAIGMLWARGSNVGDITAYLDGVSLGAVTGYNATNVNHQWFWIADDVTEGLHTLTLKITGKQPLSSGYNAAVSMVYIKPNP